ncbi:MAG: toll/interleukin-1 receptor domain-containing protein [Verrucomicrobia bacterium]|nr:toll/interleukin-1 receptor domain-containing protein [Verrucomicrobiota bacterium]
MEKPVVFLSHASADKRQLLKLKALLERKAAGFLRFFLSSDGESIPLGTSWHERIVKALRNAKLMFVFVSPESAKSGWVFFEAGYAFSRGVRVVPLCLPGITISRLPSPLNLLQAQELHSAKALNEIIRVCNEVFDTHIAYDFTPKDFAEVFGSRDEGVKPLPEWENLINRIELSVTAKTGSDVQFAAICKARKLDCKADGLGEKRWSTAIVSSGITLTTRRRSNRFDYLDDSKVEEEKEPVPENETSDVVVSPQLLHVTAPLLDEWAKRVRVVDPIKMKVVFADSIRMEAEPHRLTTRIYGSEISMNEDGSLRIWDLRFILSNAVEPVYRDDSFVPASLQMAFDRRFSDVSLREIITTLFEKRVLWVVGKRSKQ